MDAEDRLYRTSTCLKPETLSTMNGTRKQQNLVVKAWGKKNTKRNHIVEEHVVAPWVLAWFI